MWLPRGLRGATRSPASAAGARSGGPGRETARPPGWSRSPSFLPLSGFACKHDDWPARVKPKHLTKSTRLQRTSAERSVQVGPGADQLQMREGRREIAELPAAEPDLLRVEAQLIRVREHLLEHEPCLVEPSGHRERLDVP